MPTSTALLSPDLYVQAMPHPAKGQIQVIFGPMFSGKTTELIRRCKRYEIANYRCIVVKYAHDQRYGDQGVATHDRQTLPAIPATSLAEVIDIIKDYDVIGIDEGQFFPDVVSIAEHLANLGKSVLVAALDGTFQREGFNDILNLIPKAESIVKLTAVCMLCFSDASYTKRKSADTALEVIGGAETYMAVCRKCYFADSPQKQSVGTQTPEKCVMNGQALDDDVSGLSVQIKKQLNFAQI